MTRFRGWMRVVAAAAALPLADAAAQEPTSDSLPWRPRRAEVTTFYDTPTPFDVTLLANLGKLRQDRDTAPVWRWGALVVADSAGRRDSVPIRARPRGVWRRKNCRFPPLRVDFARETSAGTAFDGLTRPKLVNHCFDDDRSEEYILSEYQLYRVYSLLTPRGYRARLLRMAYADSGSGKVRMRRYAIVTEDADALAARLGGRQNEITALRKDDLDAESNAIASVFMFMIGNTDWSTGGLHNIQLVETPASVIYVIPYDFDYSGAVNAHYAVPPPMLRLPNVRTRLFRGPCLSVAEYEKAFALLREKRESIYALYRDEVGKLMRPHTVKRTLEYFDDFYEILGDPKRVKREILDACLKDT